MQFDAAPKRPRTLSGEEDPDLKDFRPPWVYLSARLATHVVIPVTILYFVFIHDHGDHEHVFQPFRRWATRQKASFFTLSPEEERLLKGQKKSPSEPSTTNP
ncbi:hypothetical protein PQX77_010753 [Marasmius sp. AFHP31]|nr:hypothetical protein PQX77_010753 [Marasmius sp. AFHP31]